MLSTIDFLARVPIFSFMQKKDLRRLSEQVHSISYAPGEVIIRQGENDTRLFMIVRGEVEIVKNMDSPKPRSLRLLKPPGYFGEMALIDGMVRSASVVARTDTQVLFLDRINLLREIEQTPAMAMELLRMMCCRIRAIEKCLIRTAGDYLQICLHCSGVKDESNQWVPLNQYIENHVESDLTGSICPNCSKKRFPQFYK